MTIFFVWVFFGVYGGLSYRGRRIFSEFPFLCQWFPVTVTATAFEWILRFDCWLMMLLVLRSRGLKGTCRCNCRVTWERVHYPASKSITTLTATSLRKTRGRPETRVSFSSYGEAWCSLLLRPPTQDHDLCSSCTAHLVHRFNLL